MSTHPNQTEERARVTLLEEVAHRFLGHSLHKIGQGKRDSYDEAQEKEAYFTAAAVLLPQFDLARALYDGESVGAIAARFGVSSELVEMRIKINNLWHHRTL